MLPQQLRGARQTKRDLVQTLCLAIQTLPHAVRQVLRQCIQLRQRVATIARHHLRRRCRRGRTQVGRKVHQGDIGLVAHAADHGHRAPHHGTHHPLVIERPQVLHGAATATHDDRVQGRATKVHQGQGGQRLHQLSRGFCTLHGGRRDNHLDMRHTPRQCRQHVVQGGGGQRGHHPDATRVTRYRPLAGHIKQPFGLQLRLQPQELLVQGTRARPLQALDHQLQLTARLVHRQVAARLHQHAFCGLKVHLRQGTAEHRAAQGCLTALVLEREVAMPTGRPREAADFASHHTACKPCGQTVADGLHQGRHPPHPRQGPLSRLAPAIHALLPASCPSRTSPQRGAYPHRHPSPSEDRTSKVISC